MADRTLRRAYRLLLRAYPKWYRREREEEMLTTLLDSSAGRRPGVREAFDLCWGGLRCRTRPVGPVAALLAVIVAVFVALLGATAGARSTIALVTPTPSEDEAAAIAAAATGQLAHNQAGEPVSCPFICPVTWTADGDQVVALDRAFDTNGRVDQVMVGYWPAEAAKSAMLTAAHDRMVSQGWRVSPVATSADVVSRRFTAEKDGLTVIMSASPQLSSSQLEPPVFLTVQRDRARLAEPMGLVGLLVGGLIGWMLACWVGRRFLEHGAGRRLGVLVTGAPALIVALLADLSVTLFMANALLGGPDTPFALAPAVGVSILFFTPEIVGVVALVFAVALTLVALPARPGRPGTDVSLVGVPAQG